MSPPQEWIISFFLSRSESQSNRLLLLSRSEFHSNRLFLLSRSESQSNHLFLLSRSESHSNPLLLLSRSESHSNPLLLLSRSESHSNLLLLLSRSESNSNFESVIHYISVGQVIVKAIPFKWYLFYNVFMSPPCYFSACIILNLIVILFRILINIFLIYPQPVRPIKISFYFQLNWN
jgi:hypothetical protein